VITDDEIMRLFERADPARDDDSRMADVAGYLAALQTRSYDMTLIDTTEAPTKPPRDNRWLLPAIIAAAILLIVAGAVVLSRDDDQDQVQLSTPPASAAVAPTTAAIAPTTAPEPSTALSVEAAIVLVRSYFDAFNAYDSDLAYSLLADGAMVDNRSWTAEQYRLGTGFSAAIGEKALLGDCEPVDSEAPAITIRCDAGYAGQGSTELGLGPYGDGWTEVMIVDGKITSINSFIDFSENGFEMQIWDPYMAWMEASHPEDIPVLYADDSGESERSIATDASNALWRQRTQEYVALRQTAERVATDFLEAFGAFDAQAAGTYVADGATTEAIVTEDVQDYRQAIELYKAWGYVQQLGTCQQVSATASALQVQCPFTYHLLGSNELGVGPFEGNAFMVTIDNATGLITDVTSTRNSTDFMVAVAEPFTAWLRATHPDAAATMTADGNPSLSPESLALWEQYRHEYVQHVLGSTPVTTTP